MTVVKIESVNRASAPDGEAFLDAVRTIGADAVERDLKREAPFQAVSLLRQIGFGALRIPSGLGGGGASLRQLLDAVITLASADSNVIHILRNHFAFVEEALRLRHDARYARWLDAAVKGAFFGLASTERSQPKAGRSLYATTLAESGDGYILSGIKYYSTGNIYSDYIKVRATGPDLVAASVIIPVDREGVQLRDDWDGIGQRLTGSGTTILEDVVVGKGEVVFDNEAWRGRTPYQATLPQLFLTAIVTGILEAVLADATRAVRDRTRNFYHAPTDRPVDDPILQQAIGVLASHAYTARTMVLTAADALDAATAATVDGTVPQDLALEASRRSAQVKVLVDELALRAASSLFDVGGASLAARDLGLDRYWRNIRTIVSHNPSSLKARSLGQYELTGQLLPDGGFF